MNIIIGTQADMSASETLWNCVIKMFLHSMKQQSRQMAVEGQHQVWMQKRQFFQVIKSLRVFKIRDKEVFAVMVKAFVTLMNTRSL